jgi:translation initiation factor IF-3
LKRPYSRSPYPSGSFTRINGKIRAREVRVIGVDGHQLGILPLGEAISLARANSVDLVEIAASATPPVCRLVDYGKYRYEQAKRDKEAKKHQHANRVKEIQLTATIDPHDFGVKLSHAIDFLCDDMKVKASLRFRGREMAHQEFGVQVVQRFIQELTPFGHPDAPPKLAGRSLNVMLSPLPRNKRAPNPNQSPSDDTDESQAANSPEPRPQQTERIPVPAATTSSSPSSAPALNTPFANLNAKSG